MPTVKIGDINMYYETQGEGEPLVLISGLGTDLSSWFCQIRDFSEKHRVIVFGQFDGHGQVTFA